MIGQTIIGDIDWNPQREVPFFIARVVDNSRSTQESFHYQTRILSSGKSVVTDEGLHPKDNNSIQDKFDSVTDHCIDTTFKLMSRIKVLNEQSALEDYSINRLSHKSLMTFFREHPRLKYDRLFLLENGNLRATWRDDIGNHIALEFFNNQTIGFVIFKHQGLNLPTSRLSGFDTMDGIKKLIAVYEFEDLLFV